MRGTLLLLIGATLASCANAPEPAPPPSPKAQRMLASLTAGKVAGAPINCVPNYNLNNQQVIDGRTLAFTNGSRTVYIVHLTPGCEPISGGPYALLSRQYGGFGRCRGDIQQVIDTLAHITVGSCTIANVVPFTRRR